MSNYAATPQGGGPTRLVSVKNGSGPVTDPPPPAKQVNPANHSEQNGKGKSTTVETVSSTVVQPKPWMRVSEVRALPEKEAWYYLPNTVGLFMGRQGRNRMLKKAPDPALATRKRANSKQIKFWDDSLAAAYADFNVWLQQQWIQMVDSDVLLYRDLLIGAIREESQQEVGTITVTQSKGGVGKSPTSANVASTLSERSRRSTTAIDNNELRGTLADDLGIDPALTMTVRQLHDLRVDNKLNTVRKYGGRLGGTKHGVQVLASNAPDQRTTLYSYLQSYECIALAQDYSLFVVNDTGNHIQGEAMQAALQLTDAAIVPHYPSSKKSLEGFTSTMRDYRNWGHTGLMHHSIAVVTGLKPGELVEDYRKELGLSKNHILLGVPWDARIDVEESVDLELMALFTEIAYLEITLACIRVRSHTKDSEGNEQPRIDVTASEEEQKSQLEKLADFYVTRQQRLMALPQLDLKPGHMVRLPSDRTPVLPYCAL